MRATDYDGTLLVGNRKDTKRMVLSSPLFIRGKSSKVSAAACKHSAVNEVFQEETNAFRAHHLCKSKMCCE